MAKEFNVSGEWTGTQANGWHVTFDIEQTNEGATQNRTIIRGSAFAEHPFVSETMTGSEEGKVSVGPGVPGQQFMFTVLWGGSKSIEARYTGTFGLDRRITGFNFPTVTPAAETTWRSDKAFNTF